MINVVTVADLLARLEALKHALGGQAQDEVQEYPPITYRP